MLWPHRRRQIHSRRLIHSGVGRLQDQSINNRPWRQTQNQWKFTPYMCFFLLRALKGPADWHAGLFLTLKPTLLLYFHRSIGCHAKFKKGAVGRAVLDILNNSAGVCEAHCWETNWPGAEWVPPQTDQSASALLLYPLVQVEGVAGQPCFARLPAGVSKTSWQDTNRVIDRLMSCFLLSALQEERCYWGNKLIRIQLK